MRSASGDLTTAARIRDRAIELFGSRGYAATSIRDIARAAEVSPALVIHHFGSKEELRRACDEYLIGSVFDEKDRTRGPQVGAAMREWLADVDRFRPYVDYLAAMLQEGGDAGNQVFDALLHETREMIDAGVADGSMRPSDDPEMRALLVALQALAPLLLRAQLARTLGADVHETATARRMTLPMLDLYTNGLYVDDRMLAAARDAMAATAPPPTDEGGA
ncbi:TetR/AcrR family transcriptional regulator [Agromyces mangrovi Wang et al. 2018]|uniref:TetR/AcrR family transcriptional regulator n=1 Tax=Agromyces mangrovi TaxID=1858653 RepID=UPI0025744EA5|nr:TetR family transcriptional regulator [Agromyces mangrovi]BDZ66058.1 putative transcriptional regulator, TetR family protein [Agromyces mangrovi]